jgi:hypothetical protein
MSKVKITGHASGSGTLTLSAPNTSSDRTITLPDATGTLLTEVADDAITLAKMASGTDGNIISYDASGNPVAIATGTDGQVLTSAGAGAQPAFEDAAAGGGITEADQWRVTANVTSSQEFTTNLERVDDTGFSKLGTGMSHTLGWWAFPSTGIWEVGFNIRFYIGSDDNITGYMRISTDGGSSYDIANYGAGGGLAGDYGSMSGRELVDVTDTSNVKVQFFVSSIGTGTYASGDTDVSLSYFTFIRLGDT